MENLLWVEQYRPKSIDECILPKSIKKTFKEFVKNNPEPLVKTVWKFYRQRPVERVICVNEDVLNKFIAQNNSVDS